MTLPITKSQAYKAAKWIKNNFSEAIAAKTTGTPFSVDFICAIACQETAYFWLNFIDDHSPNEILARCVLDASGDYPDTKRSAFPKNTSEFRAKYGDQITELLITEANATRAMRGFGPKQWVYKGYGIFQYDLQHVDKNPDFFFKKQWYIFDECLNRLLEELIQKHSKTNNLWRTAKAYNGTGPSATAYANNVTQYTQYCSEVQPQR